jgi:hypothetical protein
MRSEIFRYRVVYRWGPSWDWKNEVVFHEYKDKQTAWQDALLLREIEGLDCVKLLTIKYEMVHESEHMTETEYITLNKPEKETANGS